MPSAEPRVREHQFRRRGRERIYLFAISKRFTGRQSTIQNGRNLVSSCTPAGIMADLERSIGRILLSHELTIISTSRADQDIGSFVRR